MVEARDLSSLLATSSTFLLSCAVKGTFTLFWFLVLRFGLVGMWTI